MKKHNYRSASCSVFLSITLFGILSSNICLAFKNDQCNTYIKKGGWFREYKYAVANGILYAGTTKAIKEKGPVSGVSSAFLEQSTFSLDPGVSTKESTSTLQSSSSWGECKLFGLRMLLEDRKKYVAQNLDEIKKQSSQGMGTHLENLAYYSGCPLLATGFFSKVVQSHFANVYDQNNAEAITQSLDQILNADPVLRDQCWLQYLDVS